MATWMVYLLVLASSVFGRPVLAEAANTAPVYLAGNHYGAVVHRRSGAWTLWAADGRRVEFPGVGTCADPQLARLPAGLWLLTVDSTGRPTLQAVSATRLPPGHRGRVAMRECAPTPAEVPAGELPSLAVPRTLIQQLLTTNLAILVDD